MPMPSPNTGGAANATRKVSVAEPEDVAANETMSGALVTSPVGSGHVIELPACAAETNARAAAIEASSRIGVSPSLRFRTILCEVAIDCKSLRSH